MDEITMDDKEIRQVVDKIKEKKKEFEEMRLMFARYNLSYAIKAQDLAKECEDFILHLETKKSYLLEAKSQPTLKNIVHYRILGEKE